ncbi:MAG: response regulator transcription factor [Bryobacteraceae bacterium]|nr:response regulator transcription factor [Bryobacteraceae bacterium]
MFEEPIRVVIADDHPVFRRGLRYVMQEESGLSIVAEAEDGAAALALIRIHDPAVAVLDIDMPKMDGFAVVKALQEEQRATAIVILTMHKDEELFNEAMNRSVQGYLLKDSAVQDIVGAVRAVAGGQYYISPAISGYLLNRNQRNAAVARRNPGLELLTPTERRVLALIAGYQTNKDIAAHLFLSRRTVENHRANICQKLELHGSHALLRFAAQNKDSLV